MKKESDFWNIIKEMLIKNTGSTTVLLEAITGCLLQVKVLAQKNIVPEKNILKWNGPTMRRETILSAEDKAVSQNVVYINWDKIEDGLKEELERGIIPIGKIIMDKDYRRKIVYAGKVTQVLQDECGISDNCIGNILKKYEIWIGDKCLFLIYEIFNRKNLECFI